MDFQTELALMTLTLFIILISAFVLFLIISGKKTKKESVTKPKTTATPPKTTEEKIREKLKDKGEITHLMILNDSKFKYNEEFLALIGNKLYYDLRKGKGVVDLSDLLETEISYEIIESNRLRVVSITPTLDKKTEIRNIKFRLYKESDDFEFNFFGRVVTPQSVKKMKLMIDRHILGASKV